MRELRKKPDAFAPHRVAWNAYLLADDAVHQSVERAAKKAEKKLGVGRKPLVYGTVIAGGAATTALLGGSPLHASLVGTFFALSLFPFRNLVNKAMEFRASAGALAEDEVRFMVNTVFKAARLPLLVSGLWNAVGGIISHSSASMAAGTFLTSFSIAAYLITSGTGMLGRAKAYFNSLTEGFRSPEPQPATIPIDR